jgi:hypothetical protein
MGLVNEPSTLRERQNTSMIHRLSTMITAGVVMVLSLSTLTFAAEIVGTVSAVDEKSTATLETTDGKALQVLISGMKPSDKVDCHPKDGKISYHKLNSQHK